VDRATQLAGATVVERGQQPRPRGAFEIVAFAASAGGLQALSQVLFTDYALPFEILSLLLLAAIIGAIFLARRPEEDDRAN